MKILTNTNLHSGGGIARRANEMISYCRKRDIPLVVIGITKKDYKVKEVGSVKIYHIPLDGGLNHSMDVYKGVRNIGELEKKLKSTIDSIQKIIENEKVDVVLSEGTFYAPWMMHKASKNLDKPTIVTFAGILTKEESDAPVPLNTLFRQIESDFNRLDNLYVFPSHLTKKEVEKIFGRNIERSIVIPNGVTPEFFEESYSSKKTNSIGFVGRNHPIKNIEFLISLAEALDRNNLNYNISIVSKIKKGKKIRKKLEARAIEIIPTMSTANLREFFAEMGIIVSPSLFETYGNVPLEAVATGTPALVSKKMGVSEVFQKLGLKNLVLEDFNSAKKVLDKVKEVMGLTIKKDTIEQIRENLRWDKVMRRYIKVCEVATPT